MIVVVLFLIVDLSPFGHMNLCLLFHNLKTDAYIQNDKKDIKSPYDCEVKGQGESYKTVGICNGPPIKPTPF